MRLANDRAFTSRKTSRLRTETFSIFRPRIAPSRSRAIVSVSGNSGIACQLTPADVAAKLFPPERNLFGVISRQLGGLEQTRRDRSHRQHPPPGSHQFTGRCGARGAGV